MEAEMACSARTLCIRQTAINHTRESAPLVKE